MLIQTVGPISPVAVSGPWVFEKFSISVFKCFHLTESLSLVRDFFRAWSEAVVHQSEVAATRGQFQNLSRCIPGGSHRDRCPRPQEEISARSGSLVRLSDGPTVINFPSPRELSSCPAPGRWSRHGCSWRPVSVHCGLSGAGLLGAELGTGFPFTRT
jgi:hypothetical protein